MKTNVLGYPRIGNQRELKFVLEQFWKRAATENKVKQVASEIRAKNWLLQNAKGIDLIPSNDFSLYDQMLDTLILFGIIPNRFKALQKHLSDLEFYFALARGYQSDGFDLTALEMTKWFDTNYHYIVPEFEEQQEFKLNPHKILSEYREALSLGIKTKPVLIGPMSLIKLGKNKAVKTIPFKDLVNKLLPLYLNLLNVLEAEGVEHVQIDEPCMALDLNAEEQTIFEKAYRVFAEKSKLKLIFTSYFDSYAKNLKLVSSLPVHAIHLDLVRGKEDLKSVLATDFNKDLIVSAGIIDGRNVWKNNYDDSLQVLQQLQNKFGQQQVWIATSCSLLHTPYDLDHEESINPAIKQWLAFSKQKLDEICDLKALMLGDKSEDVRNNYVENIEAYSSRKSSQLIHNKAVKERVAFIDEKFAQRISPFSVRQKQQQIALGLPLFPTTTIGSFPQSKEVRRWRSKFKKGEVTAFQYDNFIKSEIQKAIEYQEDCELDVLVHGEFERNDMVEFFGEKLEGFVFTQKAWVQSYGSRCVKPPIIYGDVSRPAPMTVKWTKYAQSLTNKPLKGMLTGPVTILQWSFVRNDQPRAQTCKQLALAIRDEVIDLESAGLKVIQIDEPAFREGLPLKASNWEEYLQWAVECFKISASGVKDETQIHTHMCYSEFNDIIESIAKMDADVITIETSRSEMELLDAFKDFNYPNEIGPGVYDIHSPRIPTVEEMVVLLNKAKALIPAQNLWVNPDCGLKTRDWKETKAALGNMHRAAQVVRKAEKVLV